MSVPHPLQNPTEETRNGETQRSSCSSWPLVRPKSSAALEDERKILCESLNSSASNSQHSLTGLHSSPFPAPHPQACLLVPEQPNMRVRAVAHIHPCYHPYLFPSHLLTPCLFQLSNVLLSLAANTLSCDRPPFSFFPLWSV